eukprot:3613205-Rhodomonas_salina.1
MEALTAIYEGCLPFMTAVWRLAAVYGSSRAMEARRQEADMGDGTLSAYAHAVRCLRLVLSVYAYADPGHVLTWRRVLSAYAHAVRCLRRELPVYTRPMRCPVLSERMVLPGSERERGGGVREDWLPLMGIRSSYAIPGTDLSYGTACLCTRWAMPGTYLGMVLPAYAHAWRCPRMACLRTCGTDPQHMVLPAYAHAGQCP